MLAEALASNNNRVKELSLGWNWIRSQGAEHLAAALNSPECKLEHLLYVCAPRPPPPN